MAKRLISAVAAVSASATVLATPTAAAAEAQYNVDSDLASNEQAAVRHCPEESSSDLIYIQGSAPGTDNERSTFPVTEDFVRYIGRNYYDGDKVWLVQSGSAIEFNISASSAYATLCGDAFMHKESDMRPRYAVLIDDVIVRDSFVSEQPEKITLFSCSEPRSAVVRIIHLSEANYGAIGVSGIEAEAASSGSLSPTDKKDLLIEFIGDSITCAYGVEAGSQNEPFTTATENFMRSYAYIAAQDLNADYSAVCCSGFGVYSGYSPDGSRMPDSLLPPIYERIGSLPAYSDAWDFAGSASDMIVLNLGTNDASYIVNDPSVRSGEFSRAYKDFLSDIRRNNPDAYIICTHGIMGYPDVYSIIEAVVKAHIEETGDERIISFALPEHRYRDGYGADWHPSKVTQSRAAEILTQKLREVIIDLR